MFESPGLAKIALQGRGHVYTVRADQLRAHLPTWNERFDDPALVFDSE